MVERKSIIEPVIILRFLLDNRAGSSLNEVLAYLASRLTFHHGVVEVVNGIKQNDVLFNAAPRARRQKL